MHPNDVSADAFLLDATVRFLMSQEGSSLEAVGSRLLGELHDEILRASKRFAAADVGVR